MFHENGYVNFLYVYVMYHLTISPLWHVYSLAYDWFHWRDGIRYSYFSFSAKSASNSLVDFSVNMVASKKYVKVKV